MIFSTKYIEGIKNHTIYLITVESKINFAKKTQKTFISPVLRDANANMPF